MILEMTVRSLLMSITYPMSPNVASKLLMFTLFCLLFLSLSASPSFLLLKACFRFRDFLLVITMKKISLLVEAFNFRISLFKAASLVSSPISSVQIHTNAFLLTSVRACFKAAKVSSVDPPNSVQFAMLLLKLSGSFVISLFCIWFT